MKFSYFVAKDLQELTESPDNPDFDIIEDTKWVTLEELQEMVDKKEVCWDNETLAALQALRKEITNQKSQIPNKSQATNLNKSQTKIPVCGL